MNEIKKILYRFRDGVKAASLREKGIHYAVILGVPITTLRSIADRYFPNDALPEQLWSADHRELKILATMIHRPDTFRCADTWVKGIQNLELAEQSCLNLFSKMPGAGHYAAKWVQSPVLYTRIAGFILYTRLFMANYQLGDDYEPYFHAVFDAVGSDSLLLKQAAISSLKRLGSQSVIYSKDILARFHTTPFYDELYDFSQVT